ncbi:MAG: FAD-dependent oxidoreductase [Burkholderiales bacterium]|nr:FAD-dependent oxidoreductase [Burkholderiales bacterium]
MLSLPHALSFEDLHAPEGLARLDAAFLASLCAASPELHSRLAAARAEPDTLSRKAEAALLIELSAFLESFVAELFGIQQALAALKSEHLRLDCLYTCKRQFVQRRAATRVKLQDVSALDGVALEGELAARFAEPFSELAFARHVTDWQGAEAEHVDDLKLALTYAGWALHTEAGRSRNRAGVLFKMPRKLDPIRLVPAVEEVRDGYKTFRLEHEHLRRRRGFELTDAGTDLVGALDQANYCIWCHEQGKDSCSQGLREKPATDGTPGAFKKTLFGVTLAGCPLEERISEFHKLKVEGQPVAALAMIVIDNPMTAATGHRICNDCMKACIYQKQDPVDIPQAETRTLKDVLALPWGFEIYSLLTRWNPLNLRAPYAKPASGRRALVVGMGPAGFTLAHYLLNEGHVVVGIDGLKIEPLASAISGVGENGERVPFRPIRDIAEVYEKLDERVMAGFGGVAEYGITVRWDKNFLKIVRLLLERRSRFSLHGGVRFGGTLDVASAFELGFDHIALCAGAGKPTLLDLPNGMARGVRTASDFLMALQLTGAAKNASIANMQLRLPVVVIGGGLTAIDTATEALAYYPVQVEKFLARYEALAEERGEAAVRAPWNDEEQAIADEFIAHARAIRAERALARKEYRPARIIELLHAWGGATIAYRRRLIDSPSYTLNHEEVEKALQEGVRFAEGLTPLAIELDRYGHAAAVRTVVQARTEEGRWEKVSEAILPAKAILVAAGTQPNTVLAREDASGIRLDGRYFQACDESGAPVSPERNAAKPRAVHVLMQRQADGRSMSFFGDMHPSYFGNVVKAMASARQGFSAVSRGMLARAAASRATDESFLGALNAALRPRVHKVVRLTHNIVEVIVHAPAAARAFKPGQFYRLQNYETLAMEVQGTRLAMEGLALTGAWVDARKGLVSTIVLEMGGSSDLCALLRPGEPVVLMGPTGTPTEIVGGETVLLAGGGLGNAVLFSIGQALRRAGSRVLYFAGYRQPGDRYKVAEIEAAADAVVWCSDRGPEFVPGRAQDAAYVGNIVEAMHAYARGALRAQPIALAEVDRVIAIGSDGMMAAVAAARHGVLAPYLKADHRAIGSINSPMQCMMKEICAQCIQPQRDPASGQVSYVFSCFNQDQPLERVDFDALRERLGQNSVQEKLTAQWIDRCLRRLGLRPQPNALSLSAAGA